MLVHRKFPLLEQEQTCSCSIGANTHFGSMSKFIFRPTPARYSSGFIGLVVGDDYATATSSRPRISADWTTAMSEMRIADVSFAN
jgi:hypothetical protein